MTPQERKMEESLHSLLSHKKIWTFLEDLAQNSDFVARVRRIRKELGIPSDGFQEIEWKKYPNEEGLRIATPKGVDEHRLGIITDALPGEFQLEGWWADAFEHLIVYNKIDLASAGFGSLVTTINLQNILHLRKHFEITADAQIKDFEETAWTHPVMLGISPYASERDILSYVKAFYKSEIRPLLDQHKSSGVDIGKSRKKSAGAKARNSFIWENRKLSIEDLTKLVSAKFKKPIDYTYVQKIILKEDRKRNVHD